MTEDADAHLALIDAIESLSYGEIPNLATTEAIARLTPVECAYVAAHLLSNMKTVVGAASALGAAIDEEWAVGYSVRAARAALLEEKAPPLLPDGFPPH